jgi:uncharacterized membrane protein YbaN (DUF454 family)
VGVFLRFLPRDPWAHVWSGQAPPAGAEKPARGAFLERLLRHGCAWQGEKTDERTFARIDCTQMAANSGEPSRANLSRLVLAGVGVLSAGLAVVGAVLPGLPSTIFVIFASYCFARSCPWLEDRLLRNRLLAPYMAFIDERRPMPRRAKAITITIVWAATTSSAVLLHVGGRLSVWLACVLAGAATLGTFAIARDWAARLFERVPVRTR